MEQKIGKGKDVLDGLFAAALRRLSKNLSATGHTQPVSADYIRVVKHFCFWYAQDVAPRELNEAAIKKFLDHFTSCTCPVPGRGSYRLCRAAMNHFLKILREMGIVASVCKPVLPEDEILHTFQEHLTKVRGITKTSASLYTRHLRPFLQAIYIGGKFDFLTLTAKNVEVSVARRAAQCKPKTAKIYCTSLRAFFRFLRLTGEIELYLEDAVPTVPNRTLSNIPKYLTEEQVTVFLSSFDVNTTIGLRDRAMAILMATVGLRAGEVGNLKFEDINWRKSSIKVYSTKSRRIDYLPLSLKAGETLSAYLKMKSQSQTRHVFVTIIAPTGRPLTASAVSAAMRRAFKRCYPDQPAHGTHVLRHSLATGMLNKGATFKEIADILRHRNIETTAIYAKVDIKNLTHAALSWPEVTI